MATFSTKAIVLRRTNYGEADRILNLLTPDRGKISGIAKGVRRGKSQLAGGLELFAVSDVTMVEGRTDLHIVTAAQIEKFYGNILHDYDRLQLGYECIKEINRVVEMTAEPEFFELLKGSFEYLDDLEINLPLIEIWFRLQLAILMGRAVDLTLDIKGKKLKSDMNYDFNPVDMAFIEKPGSQFTAEHIKVLRLLQIKNPKLVNQVGGIGQLLPECLWLARAITH